MFKVNNRNTRTRCEICSKLTIKTPERGHWCRSGVFIVNFERISQLALVFLLLTLGRKIPTGFNKRVGHGIYSSIMILNRFKFIKRMIAYDDSTTRND